jgi:hypothetical protein
MLLFVMGLSGYSGIITYEPRNHREEGSQGSLLIGTSAE